MRYFDLYGFIDTEINCAKEQVELALGIQLFLHDSSFHGGNYFRCGNIGEEHFILQNNYNTLMQEWEEEEFEDHRIILYVNATHRHDAVQTALKVYAPAAELLRTETL